MIIAVEGGLTRIKDELRQKGYQVVDLKEDIQADAIVYYDDGQPFSTMDGEIRHGFHNTANQTGKPAFIVNAYNKDIGQIDEMLQRRSYSPLFTGFE